MRRRSKRNSTRTSVSVGGGDNRLCVVLAESWNVVVGKNFGTHVVHQTRSYFFANFNEEICVLLWKAA